MHHSALPLFLLFMLPAFLWASADDYQKAEFSADGKTLRYRYLEPAKLEPGQKYPLVLFLQGAGERGDDNKPKEGHASWVPAFNDPELLPWLFAQKRD
jgi:predicted peptidase